jgi:hypothetical protein
MVRSLTRTPPSAACRVRRRRQHPVTTPMFPSRTRRSRTTGDASGTIAPCQPRLVVDAMAPGTNVVHFADRACWAPARSTGWVSDGRRVT